MSFVYLQFTPCVNYVHSRWGYAFPVRMCIPCEAHLQSRWGTSPFLVSMCIPSKLHPHSRSVCAFPMRHIPFPVRMCIPGEDESRWNKHPHREWRCDSPGMHILTRNGDMPYREWGYALPGIELCLTGNGMWLTGNAHSLKRVVDKHLFQYIFRGIFLQLIANTFAPIFEQVIVYYLLDYFNQTNLFRSLNVPDQEKITPCLYQSCPGRAEPTDTVKFGDSTANISLFSNPRFPNIKLSRFLPNLIIKFDLYV